LTLGPAPVLTIRFVSAPPLPVSSPPVISPSADGPGIMSGLLASLSTSSVGGVASTVPIENRSAPDSLLASGLERSLLQGLLQLTIVTQPLVIDLGAGIADTPETARPTADEHRVSWGSATGRYTNELVKVYQQNVDRLFSTNGW